MLFKIKEATQKIVVHDILFQENTNLLTPVSFKVFYQKYLLNLDITILASSSRLYFKIFRDFFFIFEPIQTKAKQY